MSPAQRMGLPEPPGFPRVSGDEPGFGIDEIPLT